jgi:hypothetical protein
MAGLVPAIHVFGLVSLKGVDARDKRGHDALLLSVKLSSPTGAGGVFVHAAERATASWVSYSAVTSLPEYSLRNEVAMIEMIAVIRM